METEGVSNGAFEQLIRDETYLNSLRLCRSVDGVSLAGFRGFLNYSSEYFGIWRFRVCEYF